MPTIKLFLQWICTCLQLAIPFPLGRLYDFRTYLSSLSELFWSNKAFVREHLSADLLKRLQAPTDSKFMMVVWPSDNREAEIQSVLRKRDRIILFKSFIDRNEPILRWAKAPKEYFANHTFTFDTNTGPTAEPLHSALDKMASGESFYLGFDTCLAALNPKFQDALTNQLNRLGTLLPAGNTPSNCFTHSFLYHGEGYQALLHQATVSDFSFQLSNSKYWRFIHPDHTPEMAAWKAPGIVGVHLSAHALIHNTFVPFQEVLAEEGDMMYFPEHWWHEVHNIGEGFGLMIGLRPFGFGKTDPRKVNPSVSFRLKTAYYALCDACDKEIGFSLQMHKVASALSMFTDRINMSRPEFRICQLSS